MRYSDTKYPVVNYPKSKLSKEVSVACDLPTHSLLPWLQPFLSPLSLKHNSSPHCFPGIEALLPVSLIPNSQAHLHPRLYITNQVSSSNQEDASWKTSLQKDGGEAEEVAGLWQRPNKACREAGDIRRATFNIPK